MKGCFACLVVFGFVYGSASAIAEDDGSDLFVPAWELPADALEPQNVRKAFEPLIPLPDVLLDKKGRTERQQSSDSLRFVGTPQKKTEEADEADETPKSKSEEKKFSLSSSETSSPAMVGSANRYFTETPLEEAPSTRREPAVWVPVIEEEYLPPRDPWLGKKLFLKQNAEVKSADDSVRVEQLLFPLIVTEVDGEWLKLGRIRVRKSDVMEAPQAQDEFTEQVRLNPTAPACWIRRGAVWQCLNDVNAAVADFTEAIRLNPQLSTAYRYRGAALSRKGDYDGSIKDLTEAIRLDPKLAIAYYSRGNTFRYKDEAVAAIQDYTAAIQLDPGMADAWNNRGVLQKRFGKIDEAIRDFTDAIRIDPKLSKAYFNRGLALDQRGDYAAAVRDYTEALRFGPRDEMTSYHRGLASFKTGDVELALKSLTDAMRANRACTNAYYHRGLVWKSKGNADAAVKDFNKAILLDPTIPLFRIERGIAWTQLREWAAAIDDFTEAIRLDPDNAEACNHLAWLLATCPSDESRNGAQEVEWGTKACELSNWKEWQHLDTLAAALAEAGDWENAVKRQEQALALTSDERCRQRCLARLELYQVKTPYRERPLEPAPQSSVDDDSQGQKRRSDWEDDIEAFNQQPAAVVNRGRILNGEVLDRYAKVLAGMREELQKKQKPSSEFIARCEGQIRKELIQHIHRRILIDGMEAQLTAEQLRQLREQIDRMFEKEIDKLKTEMKVGTREELESELIKIGISLQNVKKAFANEQLERGYFNSLATGGPEVSHQEVEDYYRSHIAEYVVNTSVEWEQIHIAFDDSATKVKAKERMESAFWKLVRGTPTADVVRMYSDGLTSRQGWMDAGSLSDKKLEQLLFEMPVGMWSEIYEGPNALQLVRVLGRRGAGHIPINEVQERIREKLQEKVNKKRRSIAIEKVFNASHFEMRYAAGGWHPPVPRPWTGRQVFLKLNAEWRPADDTARIEHIEFPATVTDVDFESLKLGRIWVRECDVMELPEALDYYTDQIRLNPANAQCWLGRGTVWHRKGYADAAQADFTEAIRLDPKLTLSYVNQ